MTAFRPVTQDQWTRMPWHAQQRWLLAANALRKQLTADLDRLARSEAARAETRRVQNLSVLEAAQRILDQLGPDPDGHKHLEQLEPPRVRAGRSNNYRRTAEYRAKEAARARERRARQKAAA